ncbi:molybdenum cofactor guanylyltransferase MobA [Mesorhizobium sp. BR1-1-16]|uniref:molybdenum cofactor guanylyltransferase MobA n=1 Tax=Mesorhizobium sp. BR1-1-16 TaxID=2876653 RepID=UPI001CCA7E38|nr:molybdenum cofactor guanylyltransferase MobA [Mesorhizobium sp. BR1-1-16]MBZ9935511.1 molybdenum cofactor guanylyltransferase MobA [Mesorhizobium sp. BR1-1-16]
MTVAGLVLAGGGSTRMGREKALVPLAGQPMLAHVIARLGPQVGPLALNANGDPARFASFGLPVVADDRPDTGPLGGVEAGLDWAARLASPPRLLVTVPVDGPLLPADLVTRLAEVAGEADRIVIAASGDRDHPVFALWPVALATMLADWRRTAKSQGVRGFLAAVGFSVATWPVAAGGPDPFFNVNAPDDLIRAEAWLAV